jgi:hypothetical protein
LELEAGKTKGAYDEIFGVVAAPESGFAVRIFHRMPRGSVDPLALGRLAAEMLMDAGAGPLLQTAVGDAAQ